MRILVTGAGGMVGRNLLAHPGAAGHAILAPPRAELDVAQAEACEAYIDREKPDLIIHLAAKVGGILANLRAPVAFLAQNMAIGLNVLNAAFAVGVPRLINLGSSCMYPKDIAGKLSEDHLLTGPPEPTNEGYALAKLAAWKLARAMTLEKPDLVYRTLIAPNLYGPHDTFDAVRSHMIPAAILKIDRALKSGDRSVEIWGDGKARREFMYAADLADFIWRHIERLEALPDPINVGVGEDRTVDDYYVAVAEAMGFDGAFTHDLERPAGMRRKLLDTAAQSRLGWRAPTALSTGLEATVRYFRTAN